MSDELKDKPIERFSTSGYETEEAYDGVGLTRRGHVERTDSPPPGDFPFTRGFEREGYRREVWAREMYAGFGSPAEANERHKFLMDNGATGGISIALDLPTQLGYDSDHELAMGEVGRTGVALDSLQDIDDLFAGVDLTQAGHIFSTANSIGPVMYAWVLLHCERRGIRPEDCHLQIQNDPIKEYVARGTHFLPIDASVRLTTDVITYSAVHTPSWLPISVSGSHMKQAGASPMQEAAFTLANGIAYLDEAQTKGLDVNRFHRSLEFHFCTEMDFFEEIAKYRAVRRVWSQIARERYHVADENLTFRLHAATSGLPLTVQQPLNNISRITLQALAQVLGGVKATRTASWDEALGIPTEDAAKTSLRINQIIAHETGIPDTTDPLGGSFYIESLTDQMCVSIYEQLDKIAEMGGALNAVRNGFYAEALADGAYREQQRRDAGERIIVGVNKYVDVDSVVHPRFRTNDANEAKQMDRLALFKSARDGRAVEQALGEMKRVCQTAENVMPSVLACVAAGATVGEVSDVWRTVFGEHSDEKGVL